MLRAFVDSLMSGLLRRAREAVRSVYLTREDAGYAVLLVLITLFLYSTLLIKGHMISGDERIDGYYQYGYFYSEALRTGETFLWNPYSYGGFPTYLNQFGGFLFLPIFLIYSILDPIDAFHAVIAGATFLGLLFAYSFGRITGLSRNASVLLAMSYCVAQLPHTFHLGLSYAHSFFLLPLLLIVVLQGKRAFAWHMRLLWILTGSMAVGIGFLAGYFVTFLYGLIFVGFYALYLDAQKHVDGRRRNLWALTTLVVSFISGLVLGAPQLVGLLDYSPHTSRTVEFGLEMGSGSGVGAIDFVRFVLPYEFQFPLDPGRGYFYIGIGSIIAVCFAIRFHRSADVLYFAGLYVFFVYFAVNGPGAFHVNAFVPPFDRIGGVSRWLLAGVFALSWIAAYGFDRLGKLEMHEIERRWLRRSAAIGGFFLGGLATLQLIISYVRASPELLQHLLNFVLFLKSRSVESLSQPSSHYLQIIDLELGRLRDTFSFSNTDFLIFFLLVSGVLGATAALASDRFRSRAHQAFFVGAVMLCIHTFVAAFGNTVPEETFLGSKSVSAQYVIRHDDGDFRYISYTTGELPRRIAEKTFAPTPAQSVVLMREFLYREVGTMYGLRNIAGFEPIRSKRQNLLIDAVLAPLSDSVVDVRAIESGAVLHDYDHDTLLRAVSSSEKIEDILRRIPLLSMMNVKYILSLYPLVDSRLTEVPLELPADLLVDFHLYENTTALPQLYLARDVVLSRDNEHDIILALLEEEDFSERTYLECDSCQAVSGRGSFDLVRKENGYVELNVAMESRGLLVYSESHLPGWIAEVDGMRVPIYTANYLFQAAEIPAGPHNVRFCYVGSFALLLERVGVRDQSCARW